MVSLRKLLPVMVVVVVFSLLLICPGLGRNNLMVAYDTRIIFITEMLLSFIAMAVFFGLRNNYCTTPIGSLGVSMRAYLSNDATIRSITTFLTSHANVLAVYIFGAGSIAMNIFSIYYLSQCMTFFEPDSASEGFRFIDAQVHLLTRVVMVIMVILEIPLLHHMSTMTSAHKQHTVANGAILVLIGANTALWLFNFLNESSVIGIFTSDFTMSTPYTGDLGNACLYSNNSIMSIFSHNVINSTFYTFYMEFCIVAIEILYGVYFIRTIRFPIISQLTNSADDYQNTIQTIVDYTNTQNICLVPKGFQQIDLDDDDGAENEGIGDETYEQDETSPLISPDRPSLQHRNKQASDAANNQGVSIEIVHPAIATDTEKPHCIRAWSMILSVFNPLYAMIVGIIQALLIQSYMLQKDHYNDGYISHQYFFQYCAVPVAVFSIVCDALPMLLITVYCCVILSKFTVRRPNPPALRTVLFISLIGISVLCCFKLIVITINLSRSASVEMAMVPTLAVSIVETLCYWPQYYLQGMLIYLGLRRKPEHSHALYTTLQGCLSYLAMNNFVHWMMGSFLEVSYMRYRVDLDSVHGWKELVLIISPFFVYFYFICTFILLEVKSILKERPPARWQLDLTVTSLRPHLR